MPDDALANFNTIRDGTKAIIRALSPMMLDEETIYALEYDDALVFHGAATSRFNAMHQEARYRGDIRKMRVLEAIIGPLPESELDDTPDDGTVRIPE